MNDSQKQAESEVSPLGLLGDRIRTARRDLRLTQEELAGPEFTKGYVSALERGAVRPSLKALEVFARRLGIPIADFLVASSEIAGEQDTAAQREDFLYQCNYAKMLMRSKNLTDARAFINDLEQYAHSFEPALPPGLAYMVPFLRGRMHLQSTELNQARTELENALQLAKGDEESTARVRNLLGVTYFQLDLPHLAVEEHLSCLKAITLGALRDPNFRVSVYRNLANDYWALNDPAHAISIYREALPILEDLSDLQQQANVFWGMSMAYQMSNDSMQAKLYGLRALHIYESAENMADAANICMNLAEIVMSEERYDEALELLERAKGLVSGTGNNAALTYLNRGYADLARRQGDLDKALDAVKMSVNFANLYFDGAQNDALQPSTSWQDPRRTYAEALHMEALIREDMGDKEAADSLFQQALLLLEPASFEETRHTINFSYAEVLSARGDFEQAAKCYRASAQFVPRSNRSGH